MKPAELGRSLTARRRAAGLTQAELAKRMGTRQSAISRLEAGRLLPSLDLLERFAQATGRPFTITFGGSEPSLTREARRARVRRVLGTYRFDSWERRPTEAEARTLVADGLTRERFQRAKAASPSER